MPARRARATSGASTEEEVFAYFGVGPDRVIDVQALAGDSTDNIPGARGIGVKTAAQLITEFGDLDTLLARAHEIKQPKRREILTAPDSVELIQLSKKLVTLCKEVPLETPLDDLGLHDPDPKTLISFTKALEFTTLTKRASEIYSVDANAIEPESALVGPAAWRGRNGRAGRSRDFGRYGSDEARLRQPAARSDKPTEVSLDGGPQALAAARAEAAITEKIDRTAYRTISDLAELDAVIAAAHDSGIVALDTETTSIDPMQSELIGLSLAPTPGSAFYVPFAHRGEGDSDLFGGDLVPGQLKEREVLDRLAPLLEAPGVLKIIHNAKVDRVVLAERGMKLAPVDDTMLMSYVLDAGRNGHGLDELAAKYLHHRTIQIGEVAGSGRTFIGFARVPIDKATEYSAEDADVTLRLWRVLKPRLAAERMAHVYDSLERPMVETLARMERRGIAIDRTILSRLSGEFAQDMARLEAEIHVLAGEPFNLGSPKQLGDILFGKMQLPGGRKTQTGAWSTAAGVLEDLAEQGNELAARILDWRQVSKLKSTYTDALPGYVNPRTHRVHTSYALAATTTGRLSSSEPNLQNIPVRNEAGRKIRTAFVAVPGTKLLSADYSQIELRLLAHIADIPQLKQAFADGHRHPRADRVGNVRRAGQGHAGRNPPPGQGDQFRHRLRHFRLRTCQPARHSARRGRRLYQQIFRALPRHPRLHGRDEAYLPRAGVRHDAVWPQVPLSEDRGVEPERARLQRARRDQCTDPGLGRRHHPPRDGADG